MSSIVKRVFYVADIVRPDGSDSDCYGEPCEPGCGYALESGWYDPSWSRDSVYDARESVRPDVYDADADPSSDDDPYTPAMWLADTLTERLGWVESVGSTDVFYSGHDDTHPYTGVSVRVAACPDGFTSEELADALDIMATRERAMFGRALTCRP